MAFMRHNNNGRRHNNNYSNNRHRSPNPTNNGGQQQGGQRRHVNRVNQVFESNGPEGRVRGTAAQIVEKYMGMARDAQVTGDRVLSMNYFQHAEHYQRLLNEITEENSAFERDRDAQRAQQAAQPEVSATDAEAGFVDGNAPPQNGDEQPRAPREPRQYQERGERPERQDRPERNDRPERSERPDRSARDNDRRFDNRAPRPDRAPPQQRRDRDEDDSDLNTLPGFLQVPITSSAPEVPAMPKAAMPDIAVPAIAPSDSAPAENAPAPKRPGRPRRIVPTEASDE